MSEKPNGDEAPRALDVLRDIWAADEGAAAQIREQEPTGRVCKNTAMLGIKGMDDEGMAEAMRGEWRRQMEREGKAPAGTRSIAQRLADGDL